MFAGPLLTLKCEQKVFKTFFSHFYVKTGPAKINIFNVKSGSAKNIVAKKAFDIATNI